MRSLLDTSVSIVVMVNSCAVLKCYCELGLREFEAEFLRSFYWRDGKEKVERKEELF